MSLGWVELFLAVVSGFFWAHPLVGSPTRVRGGWIVSATHFYVVLLRTRVGYQFGGRFSLLLHGPTNVGHRASTAKAIGQKECILGYHSHHGLALCVYYKG